MALISIVTPSYNQAAFLEQTIQSVLKQDYTPIEYIIVDGGSTDGSVEIIHKYANHLAWWVTEPDSGQAEAINKGFVRAQGEFIAWLNSDDLYLPGALSLAVKYLQANPKVGMVYGDALTIDNLGQPLNKLPFGDWGLKELMGFRMICQPAVIMRRNVLEQAHTTPKGLALDKSFHFMLDHHLWLRMARVAPIEHISSMLAAARHHPEAKNVAQATGFAQETLRVFEWMQHQPDLAALVKRDRKYVEAGAYRLRARYLLDGDLPGPALNAYVHALRCDPGFTLKHWHRITYAALRLLGVKGLEDWYFLLRQNRKPELTDFPGIDSWPGLSLTPNS